MVPKNFDQKKFKTFRRLKTVKSKFEANKTTQRNAFITELSKFSSVWKFLGLSKLS